jgi:hypothetical protein
MATPFHGQRNRTKSEQFFIWNRRNRAHYTWIYTDAAPDPGAVSFAGVENRHSHGTASVMYNHSAHHTKEKCKMRDTTRLLISLALLMVTGCQPVVPITAGAVEDTAQASITTTTTMTNTSLSQGSGQPGPVHCLVDFEATVRQGPSSGVALLGVFDFRVDEAGVLYGKLMQENGGEILAAGQVNGRAIHLVFELGEEQLVFGVGTAKVRITNDTCGLALGGPFVGPAPGDSGDWLARRLGGNPGSTPACDVACD